jgi:hypothetical protein
MSPFSTHLFPFFRALVFCSIKKIKPFSRLTKNGRNHKKDWKSGRGEVASIVWLKSTITFSLFYTVYHSFSKSRNQDSRNKHLAVIKYENDSPELPFPSCNFYRNSLFSGDKLTGVDLNHIRSGDVTRNFPFFSQ